MTGQTISHYKILEKIGEGGMGVVYKAEDTKLKRFVALKFLPPELTRDAEARERFVQEAQAASALDHTNISTVYEIGQTDDGRMFISMAYYEGETLKEILTRGSLRPREALELASQIARGLSRAHESNIVHRDIKPANIMVTRREEAKLLDFGLAKLAGQVGLTKTGTTVGTAAYMSPEQARGEEVDHRTDIWSLGVVLYEMVTGKRPFLGEHEHAVTYSIMNEEPKPLNQLRPELPHELQQIIDRALAKSPYQRYQSADDLAADLDRLNKHLGDSVERAASASNKSDAERTSRRWPVGAAAIVVLALAVLAYVTQFRGGGDHHATTIEPAAEKPTAMVEFDRSIVVLPFEDISPSGDNEYFSDGLTDEIIADLSKVHSLRVISRTSAMALKGTDMDVKAIGERLDVRYVLEGSVRKAGDQLKITAQLIDATVDAHVWTDQYDGTLEDVFDMQEKVSRSIVGALEVKLSPDEDRVIAARPLDDVRAYELYLRAQEKSRSMSEEAVDSAIDDLERGLSIVGDNALIYAAMGYAYWQYANIGAKTFDEIKSKVKECSEKVFELEPESAHGYMLLCRLEIHGGNIDSQIEYLKKVLERDPKNTDALLWLAYAYGDHAKMDAARKLLETVEKNDPLQPGLWLAKGYINLMDGRFDEALQIVEMPRYEKIETVPKRIFSAILFIYTHRPEDAVRAVVALEEDVPGSYLARLMRFLLDAYEGKKESVEKLMTPEFVAATKQDYQYSMMVAEGYAMLGQKEEALDWLETTIDRGFNNYVYMSQHDPCLKTLREEKRFKELMQRAKANCDQIEVLE